MTKALKILRIDASARKTGSVSRELADIYIDRIAEFRPVHVQTRDVSDGVPLVTHDWITANFTPDDVRTSEHRTALATSDKLVAELTDSELLVISTPIYNFSTPATLKLWVDQIARAGLTFRYTEDGPVGLLNGKRAVILVASGGTEVGSEIDFATPYLRHILAFVGITDVEIVAADQLMASGPEKIKLAKDRIHALAS